MKYIIIENSKSIVIRPFNECSMRVFKLEGVNLYFFKDWESVIKWLTVNNNNFSV